MTRKHATMTDGEGICLAFQSEHGGFDCSEAAIDRVSGALICNDGTLEGLGEGVADAAIYPTAEIFAGARLLALDRAAEGYAKRACPVDTGRLRNSITHIVDEGTRHVIIGTNVEYAPYVELGTRHQKPQPFLKPAANDHYSTYKGIFLKHLRG